MIHLILLALAAIAVEPDPRGWHQGTVAERAPRVIAGPEQVARIPMPRSLLARLEGPTVLVYFSPTCPHCREVAHEVDALSGVLAGKARILWVASGSASEGELLEFRATYGIRDPIVHDTERDISAAMAIQSTPSAMLVRPAGRGRVDVLEVWYPYLPGFDSLVQGRVLGDPWAAYTPHVYQGNNACGVCHGAEHASWLLTHHSVAWRSLVRTESEANPECTSCHVTGAGETTGWDGSGSSPLVDVGCEACHGPGGPHDGKPTDSLETCVGCHDAKHSIAFDRAQGVALVDHYRAGQLTPKQVQERRLALHDGEAPRELLAFAEGANVGADACTSCHAAEHAAWQEDPHRRAMATLSAKARAGDPDCVRCHATPRRSGPPPTAVDDYLLDDGVGCESCHGPGEAHVAAEGGTDNIEKLGDDCPVCVIEAVCTRCHTADQDPDWDLKRDLLRVRHTPMSAAPG